jgi:cell division inhibitor SulA
MGGHLLLLTGMVDKRTMEKYEKEAKELGRESWYLSWALDLNQEERNKVCDVGRSGSVIERGGSSEARKAEREELLEYCRRQRKGRR